MRRKISFIEFDFILFIPTVALIVIGILFIYSSGVSSTGIVFSKEYIKQIIWAASGIIIFFLVAFFPFSRFKSISPFLYLGSVLILLLTPIIGKEVNGARSWIGVGDIGIQPSEFTKIIVILFLARYIVNNEKHMDSLKIFLVGFAIVLLPMFLILIQPDVGTTLVYLPIFLVMMYIGGTKTEYIAFIVLILVFIGVLVSVFAFRDYVGIHTPSLIFSLVEETTLKYIALSFFAILVTSLLGYVLIKKRYFYWITYFSLILCISIIGAKATEFVLKDYQIMRLIIFLKPDIDPRGYGWNIIQSVTAVGSGGFWGKGFLHGTQSHYRFLPQQSTDFIFSILSEEWGFVGCFLVFLLFFTILIRGVYVAYSSRDNYAVLVGTGIVSMFFFHIIVNIGMTIGIMPITGIPLFLLSYGGSSLWTALIGVAILTSIKMESGRHLL